MAQHTSAAPHSYSARWVFPVAGPPLANAIVVVRDAKIEAIEPAGRRTADVDFGNAALIPGLVNAHTHLDLSGARGLIPPTDPAHFTDWLRGVIAYRRTRTPEQLQADIRAGLAECLSHGTTLIGDISSDGGSWEAVANSRARAVVFREVLGLTPAVEERWNAVCDWAMARQHASATCRPGVSPHAPYSVSAAVIAQASASGWPSTLHLAESPAELELLEHRRGPFVDFLKEMNVWHPAALANSLADVVRALHSPGPALCAHANYLPSTIQLPQPATVVYCPRTHAAFGHPPHPFRALLEQGVRVCLGTDSLASNPDLDLLAEARFLHRLYPDFPTDQLVRMITLTGAESLGWADEVGSLQPGKSADMVAVPLPDRDAADPHSLLFANQAGERRTVFRGEMRVPVPSVRGWAE